MSSKQDYLSKYADKKAKKKKSRKKPKKLNSFIDEDANDFVPTDPIDYEEEDGPVIVSAQDVPVSLHTFDDQLSRRDDGESKPRGEKKRRRKRRHDSDDDFSDEGNRLSTKSSRSSNRRRRYDSDDEEEDLNARMSEKREKKDSLSARKRYDSDDHNDASPNDHRSSRLKLRITREKEVKRRRYDSDDEDEDEEPRRKPKRYDSDEDGHRESLRHKSSKRKSRYDSDDEVNLDDAGHKTGTLRSKRYDSDDESTNIPIRDLGKDREQREKMSSGHTAGLQSSHQFREAERSIQKNKFSDVQDLDRGETIYRDNDGKKVDTETSSSTVVDEKVSDPSWNMGSTQRKQMEAIAQEYQMASEGTFARSRNDTDKYLRDFVRDGDPMAKQGMVRSNGKRLYKGPQPKPNRYGIRPGYRWDGIDRGNGFEDEVLGMLYGKGRKEEEKYKWSCADM